MVVATVVVLEGCGWTVQQSRLVAVTLDLAEPDHAAIPSVRVLEKSHVAASMGQKGETAA